MECRVTDLRYKEVINIKSGQRLGYVCDVIVDTAAGKVLALVVPGPCRFFGMIGHEDDYIIPWDCIPRISEDIILVDGDSRIRRGRGNRRSRF
jgi:YlmC/YmxH family sporulation protein